MKKIIVTLCACVLIGCSVPSERVALRLVHTNDTHSCVMPISPHYSDTAQADKGGFVRRAALVRDMRKEYPELLLFDSGDFSQGSAYYNMYKGEVEVLLMNHMGYDAAVLGNHEFDFGLENLARLCKMASFPFVCANYGVEGTVLEGLVSPYVVLERKGVRIGVFGLGVRLEGLVARENYEGVTFEDPIVAADRVVTILKEEEHCDMIVCLSHLGWDISGTDDTEIVPALRHVDVVLGAHSHTYFERLEVLNDADGRPVYCHQMGKNGRFVGVMDIEMERMDAYSK